MAVSSEPFGWVGTSGLLPSGKTEAGGSLVTGAVGFTVPVAAQRLDTERIVLLNAMIPRPGETPGDWFATAGAGPARISQARQQGYPEEFTDEVYFFHDVPPSALIGPEPEQSDGIFESVADFASWPDVPITVLAGEDDRFFPFPFQDAQAQERLGLSAVPVPGGHLAGLAFPDDVTAALL